MVSRPPQTPPAPGPFRGGSFLRISHDAVARLIRAQELRHGDRRHITADTPLGLPAGLRSASHLRNLFRTFQHRTDDVQNLCAYWEYDPHHSRLGISGQKAQTALGDG